MYLYHVIFVPWAGGLFCTIKNLNLNQQLINHLMDFILSHILQCYATFCVGNFVELTYFISHPGLMQILIDLRTSNVCKVRSCIKGMQNHNSRRNIFFLFKHHAIDVSRSSKKFKFYNFNLCC